MLYRLRQAFKRNMADEEKTFKQDYDRRNKRHIRHGHKERRGRGKTPRRGGRRLHSVLRRRRKSDEGQGGVEELPAHTVPVRLHRFGDYSLQTQLPIPKREQEMKFELASSTWGEEEKL